VFGFKGKSPDFLKVVAPFLWSYDIEKIDLEKDKKRIITNVLNLGTKPAIEMLFKAYKKDEIREVVEKPLPGEWNDKSFNFWSIVFGIEPEKAVRVIS